MNYKSKLLVSINGADYIDIFRSMDEKVAIEFTAIPDSNNHHLLIQDKNGNSVSFKCILINQPLTANAANISNRTPVNIQGLPDTREVQRQVDPDLSYESPAPSPA